MEDKLYMFNPFRINEWKDEEVQEQFELLLNQYDHEADIVSLMARNVEVLANQMYLMGEMIARYSERVSNLKLEVKVKSALIIQEERNAWSRLNKGKAPAMTYFEAVADSKLMEERKQLIDCETRLTRFKYAYNATEERMNAQKKKIEAFKYEEFGN
jgi:hypothetical protein